MNTNRCPRSWLLLACVLGVGISTRAGGGFPRTEAERALGAARPRGACHRPRLGRRDLHRGQRHADLLRRLAIRLRRRHRQAGVSHPDARRAPGPGPGPRFPGRPGALWQLAGQPGGNGSAPVQLSRTEVQRGQHRRFRGRRGAAGRRHRDDGPLHLPVERARHLALDGAPDRTDRARPGRPSRCASSPRGPGRPRIRKCSRSPKGWTCRATWRTAWISGAA